MREIMKIMGLSEFSHQLSWFVTAFFTFIWISISSTAIAHISFLPKTNVVILFFYFFIFHISLINLSFFISVFFSNSKLAAIVGPVILFATILPKYLFFGTNSNEAYNAKFGAAILSPTAFSFGADILSSYEYAGIGVQFNNMNENTFSMYSVLSVMVFDIFLYGFLAWYLDQTIPHEFGSPKHPLFIFSPTYWLPFSKKIKQLFFRNNGENMEFQACFHSLPAGIHHT
jgi:ATP-binding cassette subfamily A (ABC1) protein 12